MLELIIIILLLQLFRSTMRDNFELSLTGRLVRLLPYRRKFVERYHRWMQSEELLELTASEPLSLEEEYAMQKTWREDKNKCTFIVLTTNTEGSDPSGEFSADPEVARMVGDVNLFLSTDDEGKKCAEVDIMIAEAAFRRTGCGREAVRLMLWYAARLGVQRVFAKINEANASSIKLFQSLGFQQVNYVAAFQELELAADLQQLLGDLQASISEDCLAPYACEDDGEEAR